MSTSVDFHGMAERDGIDPNDLSVTDDRMGELREKLAAMQHEQWSGWMEYLFKRCKRAYLMSDELTIVEGDVQRWKRQVATPYTDLPENEKESDRIEADKYIDLIRSEVLGVVGDIEATASIDSSMPGLGNLVKTKIADLRRRYGGRDE